jgi:hypothetical protein
MLAAAGLSFTDVAQSIGRTRGHHPRGQDGETEVLRRLLTATGVELDMCRCEMEQYKRKPKELSRAGRPSKPEAVAGGDRGEDACGSAQSPAVAAQ